MIVSKEKKEEGTSDRSISNMLFFFLVQASARGMLS